MDRFYSIADYPFDVQVSAASGYPIVSDLQHTLARVLQFFYLPHVPQNSVPYHEPFSSHTAVGTLHSTALNCYYHFDLHLTAEGLAADVVDLMDTFEPEIVNQAVREAPGHLLWVHGACLVRGDETIMLVAPTGTGKTTLSLGLLAHGYRLLTDDIILIDLATNRILPVPRCPKYRDPAPALLASMGIALPETVGHYVLLSSQDILSTPVPAVFDRLYMMQRDAATPSASQPLGLTDGILALLPHTNLLAVDPDLSIAHRLFANTRFSSVYLDDYERDLIQIAHG